MNTYKYSFVSRFMYRYSNFIATILLLFHALVSFSALWINLVNIIPLILNLIVLYLLNRFFFRVYKYFPFKIDIDNEKMICSDFFFKDRKVEIKLIDIDGIEGGIFSKRATSPVYVYNSKDNIKIGLFQHMNDFNKVLTVILSNIKGDLYKKLMDDIKERENILTKRNTPKRKAPKRKS